MWRFEPHAFFRSRNRKGEKERVMKSRGVNSNEEFYCTKEVYSGHTSARSWTRATTAARRPLLADRNMAAPVRERERERERESQSLHTPPRVPTKYINIKI